VLKKILILELAGIAAIAAAMLAGGRPSRASGALASSSSVCLPARQVAGRPALSGAVPLQRPRSAFLSGLSPLSEAPAPPASRFIGIRMLVTAYCPCEKCCGPWARQPWEKRRMASGDRLAPLVAGGVHFAAADTGHYPFGTALDVPGYGPCTVKDRGGAISGPKRLDVFFPTHPEALRWGRRTLDVTIVKETPR